MSAHSNHQMLWFIYDRIDYVISLFLTGVWAKTFWPEIVHGVFSVVTAVLVVIAVFFAKRFLKKHFPDEHRQTDKSNS